jgi:hypothetical protein
MNEIWKPIDGYDHPYKVSNRGRVLGKYGILAVTNAKMCTSTKNGLMTESGTTAPTAVLI